MHAEAKVYLKVELRPRFDIQEHAPWCQGYWTRAQALVVLPHISAKSVAHAQPDTTHRATSQDLRGQALSRE